MKGIAGSVAMSPGFFRQPTLSPRDASRAVHFGFLRLPLMNEGTCDPFGSRDIGRGLALHSVDSTPFVSTLADQGDGRPRTVGSLS